ncbi:response regulator transcription factor [Pontibacter ramchanderi]|uniref:LuxR family two component transcriptional regulator n=1 Tax=Pontibacter ramchanderi TaxID=1179743 RepID=A0A2N3V2X4_9BACT|nr:response regulator transcription factor [Pontibacter ramchanderi]PKV75958.1 LuxR family two component transcriptional regulator [Pontibacter ramchanderi]
MLAEKISLIIAEDHVVLRQGLKALLEKDTDLEIVGEAENGREVLDMLANRHADIVLMDVNMPVMDGFEATAQIRSNFPDTKVIALSMHSNMPFVQKMLDCGAAGYLPKTANSNELSAAIKLVDSGTRYISGNLSIELLEQSKMKEEHRFQKPANDKGLSKREVEVLALVAEGYTNMEIADKLFTSRRTIETHRQNILEKTQAKNTANLIKYAVENGII